MEEGRGGDGGRGGGDEGGDGGRDGGGGASLEVENEDIQGINRKKRNRREVSHLFSRCFHRVFP